MNSDENNPPFFNEHRSSVSHSSISAIDLALQCDNRGVKSYESKLKDNLEAEKIAKKE